MSRLTRFLADRFASNTDTPAAPRTRLGLSQLEAREVPAIALVGDTLTITGSGWNDNVTVTVSGTNTATTVDDNITATRVATKITLAGGTETVQESKTFNIGLVKSISANLGNGTNRFENKTAISSTATGGTGADTLIGGSSTDLLDGLGGNDVLRGKAGADILYGRTGNDRLYGGSGSGDMLYAGSGVNGLYGGSGMDYLWGGSGSDRILFDGSGDYVQGGYSAAKDVIVTFEGTTSNETVNLHGGTGTFDNQGWTQSEIEQVDGALAVLHETKGNPAFLRYDGDGLTFRRVGEHLSGGGSNVLGWNGDSGEITLTQKTFNGSAALVHEVALHEIGHNWDESDENGSVGQFRSISGWIPNFGVPIPGFTVSGDGAWMHKTDADFTRTYAKENPKEDFAESFAAFWMHEMGEQAPMANKHFADLPEKMAYMDDFVIQVV